MITPISPAIPAFSFRAISLLLVAMLYLPAEAQTPSTYIQASRTFHTPQEFTEITAGRVEMIHSAQLLRAGQGLIGGEKGIVTWDSAGGFSPFPAGRLLPWNEITVIAQESQSLLWIGTTKGAIRYNEQTGEMKYFAGMRWLPDDKVTGIGFDIRATVRAVWIETPKGMSRIIFEPMTLEDKSRHFVERVRARHVRHGLTSDSRLMTPGDLSTNRMVSSDNDGLWTAMYVAAEAFRFAVTKSPEAREYARIGMRALMRLEAISGIPGFPARSFIKIGVDDQPSDGEWHTTPDGEWRWKADTSSDEIVGHYFVYPIYYDLVADEKEKSEIRALVERMTNHILDNNFQLIDVDGKRTRWGWWAPADIWEDPDETGLRALHMLSHLRVAHYLTKNPRYESAYRELIEKHNYHLLTRNQKINIPGRINHSDDELAFLSYYPLLSYEKDQELVKIYRESLERSWQIERPERNPLWNFIFAVGTESKEFDRAESLRTLREIPMDQIEWSVVNSHRLDVLRDPASDRFRRAQSFEVLPYDELPMSKWNGNPYRLDGGNGGRTEDDGAYFLLPYWMGRYHRLIDE
ncbi:MAG: hypothetical protein KF868_16465 [Acidobacteria bacterium]|nr:hypothetical protein [Acidobacteriota bacterium]MCW5967329.1 hypothetical protein [Blastocatellales bacterium]